MAKVTLRHLQLGGVHEHRPDGDVAVRADTHHLHHLIISVRQNESNLGADGLEVSELVVERLPLLRLQLRQPIKHRVHNKMAHRLLNLLSMKMRTVNLPANFSEVMWTNLRPFLVS